MDSNKASKILSELSNWFNVREGEVLQFSVDNEVYTVVDHNPEIISCGPYNDNIKLQICEGLFVSEFGGCDTVSLRVESGDKIVIGKKDITLKIRGFDSKSNIRSRNVRIFCVCKENTNKAG